MSDRVQHIENAGFTNTNKPVTPLFYYIYAANDTELAVEKFCVKSLNLRRNYATSLARMQQHLPGCKVLPGSVLQTQLCMLCMLVHGCLAKFCVTAKSELHNVNFLHR